MLLTYTASTLAFEESTFRADARETAGTVRRARRADGGVANRKPPRAKLARAVDDQRAIEAFATPASYDAGLGRRNVPQASGPSLTTLSFMAKTPARERWIATTRAFPRRPRPRPRRPLRRRERVDVERRVRHLRAHASASRTVIAAVRAAVPNLRRHRRRRRPRFGVGGIHRSSAPIVPPWRNRRRRAHRRWS